jgi:FMN-dependent oxidoreductase (nitrilotriacetate monooxygenase family)
MTERRQLRLGAFMRPVSIHTAWWRYPGAYPDANFNFRHIARFAQTLERGKFDAFFMADHLALLNMPMSALKRSATTTSFDPLTLLPALAVVTERLGLIATASTTFNDPYHIARKFASLDHISNGRAGWNLVTTSNPEAALNFGLEEHVEHGERYRKAREFYDVVTGLWDSWADDAFIRDVESGIYFDPDRMHVLDHKGPYFSVRGPLSSRVPCRAGRSSSRRVRQTRDGRSQPKPPKWFSPQAARWRTPSASTPMSKPACKPSAATRTT